MARAQAFDLNALTPSVSGRAASDYDWSHRSRGAVSGVVRAHLGDIATPLARFLADSESVVGCVAWITSPRLMDQLVGKPVSLIVNKEWALRQGDMSPSAVRNRENLARLSGGLYRSDFPAPLNQIRGATNEPIDAVRCVGHNLRGRQANNPLMHHKFAVRLSDGNPVAVWTGSFNFSVNAESSLENAIEIHDPAIAAAYLAEWARVAAVSEPLDFAAGKAAPSWGPRKPPTAPATATATAAAPAPRRRASARTTAKKPAARAGTTAVKQAAAPKAATVKPRATNRAKASSKSEASTRVPTPKKGAAPTPAKRSGTPRRKSVRSAPRQAGKASQ